MGMLPFVSDLPPQLQERVVCSVSAAAKFDVPANIVLAVAEKEGGKPGQWVRNTNGTHDVGPMQFNTAYLSTLARYGITADDVAAAGCYPYDLAAWRIGGHLRHDTGDMWTRAANYHSRTPIYNQTYRADLMRKANKWAAWLEARVATIDVTKPGAVPTTPTTASASPAPSQQAAATKPIYRTAYVPRQITISNQVAQ
jgi:hypothetical protein